MIRNRLLRATLLATTGLWMAARPSDLLTDLRLTAKQVQDISIQAVTSDVLSTPHLPYDARRWATGLSVSARIQAVQALGQVVRTYTTTADFRNRYDEWLQRHYNISQAQTQEANQAFAVQTADIQETYSQLMAQSAQAFAQMDPAMLRMVLQSHLDGKGEALNTAEGDEKAKLTAEVAQLRKLQTISRTNPAEFKKQYLAYMTQSMNQEINRDLDKQKQNLAADKQKSAEYQKRLAEYKANVNPNIALKKKLHEFIVLTESVDFGAKLMPDGNRIEFVNPVYRTKSNDWKILYRMGRQPVMAARTFAQSWLKDLL